jgi:hypothetical protein
LHAGRKRIGCRPGDFSRAARFRIAFGGKAGAGRDEQEQQWRMQEDPPVRRSDGGALLFPIVVHGVSSL